MTYALTVTKLAKVIPKNLWISEVVHALTVAIFRLIHALTVASLRINGSSPNKYL
jgi:hypothetical protein